MKRILLLLLLLWVPGIQGQEIEETNTDIIYQQAAEEYQQGNFEQALRLTRHGLSLAPEYHDIRILQIRTLWALNNSPAAAEDLSLLLDKAPHYVDVKPLALQRLNHFETSSKALEWAKQLEEIYPEDREIKFRKIQLLLKNKQSEVARELAMDLISKEGISGEQRYGLQSIINQTVTDEVGVQYLHLSFSEDYGRNEAWNNLSAEYQHNFNRTSVIGRINYSDRGYDQGLMYELEAYPVFSDRFYAFASIGFSGDAIFPEFRSNVSAYYNFGKVWEGEAGGRLLAFNDQSYFTGILGLSLYQGKFLFNVRSFLGPERKEQLLQNYQGNIRYYLNQSDNYIFVKAGTGIAPDEHFRQPDAQVNPQLEAYYANLGIRHLFWKRHIAQLEVGFLTEDITSTRSGEQFHIGLGYRFRF